MLPWTPVATHSRAAFPDPAAWMNPVSRYPRNGGSVFTRDATLVQDVVGRGGLLVLPGHRDVVPVRLLERIVADAVREGDAIAHVRDEGVVPAVTDDDSVDL